MLPVQRMGYKAQRLGFSISRGWTLLLLVIGALVAAAFWIGPLRPLPAELQLLAVVGDQAVTSIEATGQLTTENTVRFPVPLAVRNVGVQPAAPVRLHLSVPGQYHITSPRGRLIGEVSSGVPLRRYTIDLEPTTVPVDSATMRLPGLDTIWIEPDLPRYYCTVDDSRIPEFVPAPSRDPATLSRVSIFYSFGTREAAERHSGLLEVQLDPSMLQARPAPMPPSFPTVILDHPDDDTDPITTDAPGAAVAAPVDTSGATAGSDSLAADSLAAQGGQMRLIASGSRRAYCGDPESPIELYTTRHQSQAGGHVYTVHVDETPRKRLYDMDGDGMVELEGWDTDADGFFEARRQARYDVPEFLTPLAQRMAAAPLEPDPTPPDSAWLALFNNTSAGPFRFSRTTDPRPVGPTRTDSLPGLPGSDTSQGMQPAGTPAAPDSPAAATPTAQDTTPTVQDTTPTPPAPAPRRGPIGTPVPLPPDSIGG